jgi:pimeloyl-CoA dehydrogenase
LQGSLRRLLQDRAPFERRRETVRSDAGWDRELWPALAQLGVTALALPEAQGGFGARPIALLPVLQELGGALALQPFLPGAVLAAAALSRAGTRAQQDELLGAIAQGSRVVTFAHDEPAARYCESWVETRARLADGRWVLDGCKHNVLFGMDAHTLVVSARTGGAADAAGGLMLFVVDAAQTQVRRAATRLIDDTPAADIEFHSARAEPLDTAEAWPTLRAVLDAGVAAACAEALGVAERACALTLDYVRTRRQFGRAIGENQAVRHRVAEMRVALETLRSAAMAALLALEIDDENERACELSRAKLLTSLHGGFIVNQGIQLHGGIGMTIEYAVGHCLRRLTVLDQLFGDGPTHAARLGERIVAKDDAAARAGS